MRKPNINIQAVKLFHSFSPKLFPFMILKNFFNQLAPYFSIYMAAEIVNELFGSRDVDRLIVLILITIGGNFIIEILRSTLNRAYNDSNDILNQREAQHFHNKALSLDYDDLENPEVNRLRRKIAGSEQSFGRGKSFLLWDIDNIISNLINICFAVYLFSEMLFVILREGIDATVIMFILGIVLLLAVNIAYIFFNERKLANFSHSGIDNMTVINRVSGAIDEYNMGKDVRIYRQDKIILWIYEVYLKTISKLAGKEYHNLEFILGITRSFLEHLLQILVYLFVCLYAMRGLFEIGSVIKYVSFMQRLIDAVMSISEKIGSMKYNTPFIEDYMSFFEIPQKMRKGTIPVEKRRDNKYEIEFKNVSFKYPGSETYAVKNLNMKFNIGQRLAVVGMNGSGKTTMIKLLCRLYDPTEGEITLNGFDIKKYDYDEYMKIFGVVFQDFKLLSFTLGQNVATSENIDKTKALKCLSMAGFDDRLESMPGGLETSLYKDFDESGVEISGGEAQKIALARALYKDAPFIVLDEPTAALDPIAEFEIYSKFNETVEDKTAIYISHRLSSCRFCDDIAVFHEGELIQRGSHDMLVADEDGKYNELWNAQAQYYNENSGAVRE